MKYPTLYTKNTNGSINIWYCETDDANAYTTSYGQLNGKIQTTLPIYCAGKNIGKSNETNPEEQCQLEVEALYKKQKKRNYFERVEDVDNAWKEPQLCYLYKDYADRVDWAGGQYVDEKINGVCCIITKDGPRSRKNEVFLSIPHIIEELEPFFKKNPSAMVHGELVRKGYLTKLNETVKLISVGRKEKDLTPQLLKDSRNEIIFVYYDSYGHDGLTDAVPFESRRKALNKSLDGLKSCVPVSHKFCYSEEQMIDYAKSYIKIGGEGVIVKSPKMPYIHKRSREALKFKKCEDAEFKIISLEEGKGNWTGCAKFAWCELPNGLREKKFKTNVRGTQEELKKALINKDKYINKWITVDFQEYSPYNTPLIPYTDLLIRDYE